MSIIQDIDSIVLSRLPEILRREADNSGRLHLYLSGDAAVAFQKSAYLLQQACPGTAVGFVRGSAGPTGRPVIIAFIDRPSLRLDYSRLVPEAGGPGFRTYLTLVDDGGYAAWKAENIEAYRPSPSLAR